MSVGSPETRRKQLPERVRRGVQGAGGARLLGAGELTERS